MAATIASAIPVLPDVASISVSPGLIFPDNSASLIIKKAGLSLTEPAGLLPSSLRYISPPFISLSLLIFARGVFPIVASSVFFIFNIFYKYKLPPR